MTVFSHKERVAFIRHRLAPTRARELESAMKVDVALADDISFLAQVLDIPNIESKPSSKRWWPILGGAVIILLLSVTMGFVFNWLETPQSARQLPPAGMIDSSLGTLIARRPNLAARRPNNAGFERKEVPPFFGRVSSISMFENWEHSESLADPETITVDVANTTWPVTLLWHSLDEVAETVNRIPLEPTQVELPTGRLSVDFEATAEKHFFQPYRIIRNGTLAGTALGPCVIDVSPEDRLIIQLDQPFAPWNAMMFRMNDEWALLTLERPSVLEDLLTYMQGRWNTEQDGKYPNTFVAWAKLGTAQLADELASTFIEQRETPKNFYRGTNHISLLVPTTEAGVSEYMRTVEQPALRQQLVDALSMISTQLSPDGNSFGEEVEMARAVVELIEENKELSTWWQAHAKLGNKLALAAIYWAYKEVEEGRWQRATELLELAETFDHQQQMFGSVIYNTACVASKASEKAGVDDELSAIERESATSKLREEAVRLFVLHGETIRQEMGSQKLLELLDNDGDIGAIRNRAEVKRLRDECARKVELSKRGSETQEQSSR